LVGGVVTSYANTGVVGVPLSFLLLTAVLWLLTVGYVAMSRHVPHAAPFYALTARGVSPVLGIAVGAVALLGYAAILNSLYGLIGSTMTGLTHAGVWWGWSAGALVVVACLGLVGGLTSARLLGALLLLEVTVIVLYLVTAVVERGGPLTLAPFSRRSASSSPCSKTRAPLLSVSVKASCGARS